MKILAAAAALAGMIGIFTTGPAAAQSIPSYATGTAEETIHGTIAAIDDRYRISVRDSRGFIDNVTLHQGTIINPTGLNLAAGQSVTILGTANGNTFRANEIDTPYQRLVALPVYPAYGYYPYAPFGYRYGWGPSFGAGLRAGGFGFRVRG